MACKACEERRKRIQKFLHLAKERFLAKFKGVKNDKIKNDTSDKNKTS